MTDNLYLIVSIAGREAALPADQIESVVEVDAITPVPRVRPHIAGLFALRSRVLTVIDSTAALGLGSVVADGPSTAAIVLVDGHAYALLVDSVDDVVPAAAPHRPPAILDPVWAAASRGAIEHDGRALLLIDPAYLVEGPAAMAA
ncbi:chemotaxis protein CheW [Sphingomonas naphthae]|uniref:Chemotaxis protein CheW n=1 Tax=Sphingomonas naphthae TaxID=1813468 RepID=A0ABY7TMX3_9SPHN|nr:chemotaxis protein CheW [Sphingomonas naphthae]WCT74570.1 chemotaxis protein CheW [Sphingomonas naphthae]